MKKNIFIAAALAAVVSVSSCTGFLNVETLGKSTIEGFFSDIDGLKTAGVGLHRTILDFYDNVYLRFADIAGDTQNASRVNCDESVLRLYDFDYIAEDNSGFPYTVWNKGYVVATNANNILYYGQKLLDKYPEYEDVIKTHFAYAYFARALAIFDLCNCYALPYGATEDASHLGVVAIDYIPGFDDKLSRHTMKVCYDRVISDLEKSLEYFGGDSMTDPTYISGLACEALLARVYLYKGDYEKAAEYARIVMDKVPLTGRDEYVKMFRKAQECPGEGIFRLNTYDEGSGMNALYTPTGVQKFEPAPEFIASFDDGDVRKELFTYVGETEDGDKYAGKSFTTVCKYLPIKSGVSDEKNRRSDFFVLRVSEMYLIHAEAICNGAAGTLEEAAQDIKALRARAMGTTSDKVSLTWSSAEDLDRTVQEERKKELCFEGHRFFDIKRRMEDMTRPASTTSTKKSLSWPDIHYALPISQLEMQVNDYMVQNEGYTGRKSLDE
jgi:starch-binding outer membrane protein, SusD/RagB family